MKKAINILCYSVSTVALISLLVSCAGMYYETGYTLDELQEWVFVSCFAIQASIIVFIIVNALGWREL